MDRIEQIWGIEGAEDRRRLAGSRLYNYILKRLNNDAIFNQLKSDQSARWGFLWVAKHDYRYTLGYWLDRIFGIKR